MAPKMSRAKKAVVIGSVAVSGLAGAGVAYAYWTSTGTGVGEAETGEAAEFVITSEDAIGDLSPGSTGQTVAFTVKNPGPGTLELGGVSVIIADSEGNPWEPTGGCLSSYYAAVMTSPPAHGALTAGSSEDGVVTVTMADSGTDQDACEGQSVPLYFVATSELPG